MFSCINHVLEYGNSLFKIKSAIQYHEDNAMKNNIHFCYICSFKTCFYVPCYTLGLILYGLDFLSKNTKDIFHSQLIEDHMRSSHQNEAFKKKNTAF